MNLPRYKCHKVVRAAKISAIVTSVVDEPTLVLDLPPGSGVGHHHVSKAWEEKHDPRVGGYFVVYDDGYESWSPADAFEEGYALMPVAQGTGPSEPVDTIDGHPYSSREKTSAAEDRLPDSFAQDAGG